MFFRKSKEIKRFKEELSKYTKLEDVRPEEEKELYRDIDLEIEIVDYINSKISDLSVENKKDPHQTETIDSMIEYLRTFKSNGNDKTLVTDLLSSFYLLKNEVTQERIDKLHNKIPVYEKQWNETRRKTYEKPHTIDIQKHIK